MQGLKQKKIEMSGLDFKEWASLFPDGIFVKAVIIYADESGTHDRSGQQKGSEYPVVAGYAAPISEWSKFCVDWKAVLNSYDVPYFHFREWAAASAVIRGKPPDSDFKKNPYRILDKKRLDKLLYTLADIAGRGNKVPIAGAIRTHVFNRIKAKLEIENPEEIELGSDPFKYSMGEFFRHYHRETWERWNDFTAPVTFFFDQSNDPQWKSALLEVYDAFAKMDLRMKGISFEDKKEMPHMPLQAADMLAYRSRQAAHKINDGTYDFTKLDNLLLAGNLRLRKEIRENRKLDILIRRQLL
ncbi:MAG TPA: DUF3800 domain-containing protein [Verrucomicrobiae bacterium]|nr:DUF3800 domain-containing protein [Verrucomicrobiae bacterium]